MDITFAAVLSGSTLSSRAHQFWTVLHKEGSLVCFCVRNLPDMSKADVRKLIQETLEAELSKAKRKGVIENIPTVTILTISKGFRFKIMNTLCGFAHKCLPSSQGCQPASVLLKKRGFGLVDYDKIFEG